MNSTLEAVPGSARFQYTAAAGLCLLAAVLPSICAAASDPMTELAAGGLVLAKSADLEMRAEELAISPKQVRVSYRFYNGSPNDVKTTVAFAMPDIAVADAAATLPLPTDDPQNLLGFSARVDGTPVSAHAVQKVFARGADRTAELERMKVPLAPHLRATDKALNKLSPADWEEARRIGLADVEEYSVGAGMRKQLSPRWTLKTTYLWEQTFPAGKEVVIEHSYKPSIGKSAQTLLADPDAIDQPWLKTYMRKYCLERDFMGAVENARQAVRSPRDAPFSEERMTYLLATASDWAKPIGEFRLIVDMGDPANLVSFCMDGAKKIGPTRYEVRKTEFVPQDDLHILILKRLRGR
jgi:Domain of unknown function (DUF4424)